MLGLVNTMPFADLEDISVGVFDIALVKRYAASRETCYDWGGRATSKSFGGAIANTVGVSVANLYGRCDPQLLFGELGWLMGKHPLSKYDDEFLGVVDNMDKTCIVDLLIKIQADGYVVDWDSCKLVKVEKQLWRDWLRVKMVGWLRFLVQKL